MKCSMALLMVFNLLNLLVQANPTDFTRVKRQNEAVSSYFEAYTHARGLEKGSTEDCSNADDVCVCEFGPDVVACAHVAKHESNFD